MCFLLPLLSLTFVFHGCKPGKPAIDRFFIVHDIVCTTDSQGVDYQVSNASSVTLSLKKTDGTTVSSKKVPHSSNGIHTVPINGLEPGRYDVVLTASNDKGSTTRSMEFLVPGYDPKTRDYFWQSFERFVHRPQEGPWYRFTVSVPVLYGQGLLDEDNVVSISEHVYIRQLRWRPNPLRWADREGCESPGLRLMQIGQMNSNIICESGKNYPFPQGWSAKGPYTCTVDWSPCNFGVQGSEITYSQVSFYLEVQAMCH